MRNRILFIFMMCYCFGQAQLRSDEEVPAALVTQREALKQEVTTHYLALKDALVASDSLAAIARGKQLGKSLNLFKFKKLTLDQMNRATTLRRELIEQIQALSTTRDISKQRQHFEGITTRFWELAGRFKPEQVSLYLQVCPMTGVSWVSDTTQIQNPYYPKNMLTCGTVEASL